MTTRLKEVDVVIVGLGWTGGILAKELTEAGMTVVALERGGMRTSENDYSLPNIRDELRYVVRHDLMQNTARDTLTVRNNPQQEALPMRRLGSFLPGEVVGGSGVHWSGHTWRWTDMEFKLRSNYEERYGKKFIPDDMTIQDWGISYAELEPYYEKFEYTAAVSGKAGNLAGKIQDGGNPFEAPRARDYPLPPLTPILASEMFTNAARNAGYHPFPRPSANASQPYTNPDGSKFGGCQYCGYCQRFGCEANAKASKMNTSSNAAWNNSGTYPSALDQCQQAVEAADYAKSQGTTVYAIGYGSESSGCTTDSTNMTPINQANITPCQVMSEMASGPSYFYSDYNQSGSSSTCESTGTSVTAINDIFTAVLSDLLIVRLIPNGTT